MTAFRLLRSLDASSRKRPAETARTLGGKAARLAWLARHALPVPRGWVLEAKYFDEIALERVPSDHAPRALLKLRAGSVLYDRAAHARAIILSQPVPPLLARELTALWELVEPNAPWGLAVRSSATCEDDDMTTMAGLAATELGVRGPDQLADALRKVWASALLPRALLYLAARGVRSVSMAVIIQVVVPAEAAGVAFSAPPRGALGELFQKNELLVNAAFGLGAPVVDGATTPDVVTIDRATGTVVQYLIAEKRQALVVGANGLGSIDLVPKKARSPALEPWALARLAELARLLEALEPKSAIDFEFVVESDRVWIVQARPAIGAAFPDGGDAETVWSRANVGEALPGAATPLTWSIARSFSERGFRKAFGSLGCTVPRGARLVANIHSRFYLNLTLFMRIAAQVPGLDPKTLIDLGGGSEVEILEKQVSGVSRRAFYARLPLTAARLLAEQMRLVGEVDRFNTYATRVRQSLGAIDFTILPDDALAVALRDARQLLDRCGELMLSCASASLASHVALKTVLARAAPVGAERIAQALSAGVGDLESALPGIALNQVAAVARRDEPARRALESGQVRTLADLPDGETRQAFAQFLVTHGDRAVREAELATPRWQEDPSVPLAMLSATLKSSRPDPEVQLRSARVRAEQELAAAERRLSMVEMSLVRVLVARSQRFARLREKTRAWVTRILGMLRVIALEIDRRLVRANPDLGAGAVFFCTYDELLTVLRAGRTDVTELVRMRRAEFARDERRPDPPVSFVGAPAAVVLPPAPGITLRGLPASGGVVEGRARVLSPAGHDSARLLPGEVLVARTTDVGLSPLFLVAAAVVTELGGPLSHAALVAREYGVPAVVNVPSVTTAIKTGDLLRVDGDRGIVERLFAPTVVPVVVT
ncbi:MAG TPA: PEP/pyruvate-binding domain-containing protein [Polyangiaceae bacterium]|nr:PEP/pyruvate-binding domain-containing protein [Polyangiaceae bacterium]